MRKQTIGLLIILTVLLLIAGAFLPILTARAMDAAEGSKVSTAPMQSLELEVTPSGEMREPADLTAKLILMGRMYSVPINEKEASMDPEAVMAAVETALAEYHDAGAFDWFDISYTSCDPMLGIDADHPEDYVTYWSVYLANEAEPYQVLRLFIDDETGRVLYIKYEKYGAFSMVDVYERNRKLLDTVTAVFFRQVGLSAFKEYADSTGIGVETMDTDGGVTCMRYVIGDAAEGELTMEFYASGTEAFEVYFPGK